MPNQKQYISQVKLLLQCLPTVASESCFAIKGGTAINLLIRNLPRLSVDVDLVYLPIVGRDQSMAGVEVGLTHIKEGLQRLYPDLKVTSQYNPSTKTVVKLYVSNSKTQIVIEPNLIIRGSVYGTENRDLVPAAVERFELFISNVPIVSVNDVFAGKICAALNRQHPRDLFDIKLLLEEGITEEIKKAFLVYLASNNRPMYELLSPNRLDQREAYQNEFLGMTNIDVSYEDLEEACEALIKWVNQALTEDDKVFLLSFKKGEPDWQKFGLPHIEKLPGIQWKLLNLSRMDKAKRLAAIAKLEKVLT